MEAPVCMLFNRIISLSTPAHLIHQVECLLGRRLCLVAALVRPCSVPVLRAAGASFSQVMLPPWPGHGPAMARPWPGHGIGLADLRWISGPKSVHNRPPCHMRGACCRAGGGLERGAARVHPTRQGGPYSCMAGGCLQEVPPAYKERFMQ